MVSLQTCSLAVSACLARDSQQQLAFLKDSLIF